MRQELTSEEAISLISRSSLPTVMTEGIFDYRVMRRLEERLKDVGVDFLPLGGKEKVLTVWSRLPENRRHNTVAVVDLDMWLFSGIPVEFQSDSLICTLGYSIENDIADDSGLLDLLDPEERDVFNSKISLFSRFQAHQIDRHLNHGEACQWPHANLAIQQANAVTLTQSGDYFQSITENHFTQCIRGKSLFEIIGGQLNRPGRFVTFSYKQLYEMASARPGVILEHMELNIRRFFQRAGA